MKVALSRLTLGDPMDYTYSPWNSPGQNTAVLEWTETSGGLWEWWHDPGVPLAFPVESAFS